MQKLTWDSYMNKALKKKEISRLINTSFRKCGLKETVVLADKLLQNGFRLATPETGEAGLFNRFYTQHGLVDLLVGTLGLTDRNELAVRFDNLQAGRRVPGNSDLVVWGRVP